MKNLKFLWPGTALRAAGILALVLMFAACSNPNGGGGGDPTVSSVTVSPKTASVAKGGNQTFTATVDGDNSPAQTVKWSVEGAAAGSGTAVTTDGGVLTVAAGETATTLTVRATSTVDDTKSDTAAVTVITVTSVTVDPATDTVAKGGTQTFTAVVAGTGSPAQTVTWSVEGVAAGSGTAINADGELTVAAGETAAALTVRATSTVDTGKSGTAAVTVSGTATVNSVTVSPNPATVVKGGTQTFTAVVAGDNSPAQTVTWSVEGAAAGSGTAINADGVLTVAAGETAAALTVRATSTVDTGRSGTAAVTVSSATVSGVTVSPNPATVVKGGTQTFTATVDGTGSPAQTVIWDVEGAAAGSGTAINMDGELTVAAGETAAALTVRATSTVDTGKSGTATVTVTGSSQPPTQYTVTFHANGGSPAPEPESVAAGGTASQPAAITRASGLFEGTVDPAAADFTFGGWYADEAGTLTYDFTAPVTGDLHLYAKWTGPSSAVDLSGQSGDNILAQALGWIAAQSLSVTTNYTIVLDAGTYTLPGVNYDGQANINTAHAVITLVGKGPVEITPSNTGSLFRIHSGELILDNNITLKELNLAYLVYAGSSGSLTMKTGATINGMVIVNSSFTMNGGVISDGAILARNSSTFTMSGGKITGCEVYLGGNSTMTGGEICDGHGVRIGDPWGGGGVVYSATFAMSGGKIYGNADILSNIGPRGGGVLVGRSSTFTMSDGEIYGNTAGNGDGGGVYVFGYGGKFIMTGGKIYGNTASRLGGGVYVDGSFSKTGGGIIYGSDEPDSSLKNTAGSGATWGQAVFYTGGDYYRDTTLNVGDDISTSTTGSGSGWGQ